MLIRHTLLYMPAQILGPVAQFAAILVFTHWLAPEPYGVLTYIMASQDFVFLLCLSWWSQYTVRYLSSHESGGDARYRDGEIAIIAGTIVPQVGASLLALLMISARLTPDLVVAAVLYTVTRCLSLHLGERTRAQSRIFDYTVATSAGPIFGFALAFIAISRISATPSAGLFGYAIAQAIVLAWVASRQSIRFAIARPDRELLRQALQFGLPLIAAGVAAWFGMNSIRILVDQYLGTAAMGLIAVGWSLGQRATTTASMFVTIAAFPLAVERFRVGAHGEAFGQITTNGLLMLGIALPAAVGLYLIQEPLVGLFVAAPFREMTLAVLPAALAAGLFRNIRTHVADQVFVLIERTAMVCAMTVAEAVAVVAGCALGLWLGGPIGAANGSAAGYGLAMIVSFAVARRRAGLRLPLAEAGLIGLATAVMAAVVRLLPLARITTGEPALRIAIIVAVGAATYALAILVLFPAVTRDALMRWRRIAVR